MESTLGERGVCKDTSPQKKIFSFLGFYSGDDAHKQNSGQAHRWVWALNFQESL